METWEGPHLLLFSQTLKDMVRFHLLDELDRFFDEMCEDAIASQKELKQILTHADSAEAQVDFVGWAPHFVRRFQEKALATLA